MKRTISICCFWVMCIVAFAQTEDPGITLPEDHGRYKNFGGFLLDMGAMMDTPSLLLPPTLNFRPFTDDAMGYTLNPDAIRLPSGVTYTTTTGFSPYSLHSLLYPHAVGGQAVLRGVTYRLNNGMRFTTYGEYDADGYKRPNPSALPWEKNNFNAAFELKSPNGKFGVRMEVKTGRNYPY